MADARTLRIVTAATFLPAFPLCLAHGVVSNSPAPAVGLVPLAFSAGVGVFLVSRQAAKRQQLPEPERGDGSEEIQAQQPEQGQEGDREDTRQPPETSHTLTPTPTQTHPILVFVVDTILAAALMIVLVFTWIDSSSGSTNSAESAMLAAYATMPLLVNFLIHLYLAVRELSRGLAIPGLTQWVAWQAVPPDCPDCGRRLRPDAPPRPPWLDEASVPRPNFHFNIRNAKLKMPAIAIPKMTMPEWRTPAWFRRRSDDDGYAPLFVAAHDDDDDATPIAPEPLYRDDPEEGEPSVRAQDPETVEPEVVDVMSKKTRKLGKNSGSSP
ncbi:hypothetical protein F5Y04DRAFT_257772 [Hypomontagnella monticulosa]|nr:hypothetical protein F5Y04DRAFT_257772 [Hypomontagnella monticulosa]